MRIFATYKGMTNADGSKSKYNTHLKWSDVCNDAAQDLMGDFTSLRAAFPEDIKLHVGNRYLLECEGILGQEILLIGNGKTVFKNKRCDMMRKALGTYHFIKGKFKGLTLADLTWDEANDYMIWLAKNSKNEATIKNTLDILSVLHEKATTKACQKAIL